MTDLKISSHQLSNQEKAASREINHQAPVVAIGEVEIQAKPETVWEIMADIERWPEWNPDVESAQLNDDLVPGSIFQWKSGPGKITSRLQHVDRPAFLAWTGKMLGIEAVHIWQIKTQNGSTMVKTEESWDGLIVRIFSRMMQKTLDQSIHQGLQYLKTEAERRAKQ
jgi:hypothetical protein